MRRTCWTAPLLGETLGEMAAIEPRGAVIHRGRGDTVISHINQSCHHVIIAPDFMGDHSLAFIYFISSKPALGSFCFVF